MKFSFCHTALFDSIYFPLYLDEPCIICSSRDKVLNVICRFKGDVFSSFRKLCFSCIKDPNINICVPLLCSCCLSHFHSYDSCPYCSKCPVCCFCDECSTCFHWSSPVSCSRDIDINSIDSCRFSVPDYFNFR